jgi:hypothetical protein
MKLPDFNSTAPSPQSARVRSLEIGTYRIPARVRMALRDGGNNIDEALVISGPLYEKLVGPSERDRLKEFEGVLLPFGTGPFSGRSEMATLKAAVDPNVHLSTSLPISKVAWWDGIVPALQIGTSKGLPVYCTRAYPDRKRRAVENISASDSDLIILRSFEWSADFCFKEYLRDIADMLRGALFRSPSGTLGVCRQVERILGESIDRKLSMMMREPVDTNHPELKRIYTFFQQEAQGRIAVLKASVAVITAAVAALRWCVEGIQDPRAQISEALNAARELSDNAPERTELLRCARYLNSCPSTDRPDPLPQSSDRDNDWLHDLIVACRYITEIKSIREHSSHSHVRVFVIHYTGTYAADGFYRQSRRYFDSLNASVDWWTGEGDHENVAINVLARMWLSDEIVLYVPNTLAQYRGGPRPLDIERDWVVQELLYATAANKSISVIQAEGISKATPSVHQDLLDQLRNFNWSAADSSLADGKLRLANRAFAKYGPRLLGRLVQEFGNPNPILHHPTPENLIPEDAQALLKGPLACALKERFAGTMRCLRSGVTPDAWILVQALYEFNGRQVGAGRRFATAEEIERTLANSRRTDGSKFEAGWIRRTIAKTLSKLHPIATQGRHPIVIEGPRKSRKKTYAFGLVRYVEDFRRDYPQVVEMPTFEEILKSILRERAGDFNDTSSTYAIN